jgi:hypothetical protein
MSRWLSRIRFTQTCEAIALKARIFSGIGCCGQLTAMTPLATKIYHFKPTFDPSALTISGWMPLFIAVLTNMSNFTMTDRDNRGLFVYR